MFKTLFDEYKKKILRKEFKNNIRNIDKIVLVAFGAIVIMAILLVVGGIISLFNEVKMDEEFFWCFSVVSLIMFTVIILRMKYLETNSDFISDKKMNAKDNMRDFVALLVDNDISVSDCSVIDSLIHIANEKKETSKETKSICVGFVESFKFFVIPAVTILIERFLSTNDSFELIRRIILVAVIPMIFAFVAVLLAVNLKSIFDSDKQKLGYLISDLLEVKCFNKTAVEMEGIYKKQKSITQTNE